VAPLELGRGGALGGGLGRGADTAGRVPGGVGVITIDSVRLGDEDVLLVAGELLVADHEGHPVAGIVEHLGEERLLPLQVEVLELHPVQADGEVDVAKVPHDLDGEEGLGRGPLRGGGPPEDASLLP